MTYIKKVSLGKVAGVSLLSFVMMFAAAAPSMNTAYGGTLDFDEICVDFTGTLFPNGIGSTDDSTFFVVKCFNAADPCFDPGVPIKATGTTTCAFVVIAQGASEIILADAVNAEWQVIGSLDLTQTCDEPAPANGKDNGKSATLIHCSGSNNHGIMIVAETRPSPGKGHKDPITREPITVFKPTSCDLSLNEGAQVIAAEGGEPILVDDGFGNLVPLVLGESPPLPVPVDDEECELTDG